MTQIGTNERPRRRLVRFCCTKCGYDLSGLPDSKCPECGGVQVLEIDPPAFSHAA